MKGCFGLPVGCIQSENCELFASFDQTYKFQVAGRVPDQPGPVGHVSVGLSYDDKMVSFAIIKFQGVWSVYGVLCSQQCRLSSSSTIESLNRPQDLCNVLTFFVINLYLLYS